LIIWAINLVKSWVLWRLETHIKTSIRCLWIPWIYVPKWSSSPHISSWMCSRKLSGYFTRYFLRWESLKVNFSHGTCGAHKIWWLENFVTFKLWPTELSIILVSSLFWGEQGDHAKSSIHEDSKISFDATKFSINFHTFKYHVWGTWYNGQHTSCSSMVIGWWCAGIVVRQTRSPKYLGEFIPQEIYNCKGVYLLSDWTIYFFLMKIISTIRTQIIFWYLLKWASKLSRWTLVY
jgi:hypothetical protein